jgi:BirA family biotin operon repressor/biotin-[acetyl-CoA-carboxylase] ligase
LREVELLGWAFLKEEILKLLKKNPDTYVSSGEICQNLLVTRAAVWKQIQSLREEGYIIEARPRRGYRLLQSPDRLYPTEIREGLSTLVMGQKKIIYFPTLVSTNDLAWSEAQGGCPEGTLVVAEEQTGGKGRLGRSWHSPYGQGLFFSLVLRPLVNPQEVARVTMLAAVALASAIGEVTGLTVGIKWPNDLLVDGKKVSGILAEMQGDQDRVNFLIMGAGINVNHQLEDFPEELRPVATSLKLAGGQRVERVRLLQACLEAFEHWYFLWLEQGFAPVLARWKELSVTLNRAVRASTLKETWEGWAQDVDEDGALLLRLPNGEMQKLATGEVSLRVK